MILEAYINPLGVTIEGKSRSQEKIKFPPLRVVIEMYSCNSCIFFFVFNTISPLLPVDVDTLAKRR